MRVPISDLDRRTFLKGTTGSMAALMVASAHSRDILAQEEDRASAFQFLNPGEAKTVDAVAEQYWPTTDDSPGAHDAGVVYYIDRALAGAYQEYQQIYQTGIGWLNQATTEQHGAVFADLDAGQQLAFLSETLGVAQATGGAGTPASATPITATPEPDSLGVEGVPLGSATPDAVPAEPADSQESVSGVPMVAGGDGPKVETLVDFLNILRTHTMEGMFSDPVYGGNRDFIGWKAVGYGGAYYVHTEEHQQSFEPLDLPIQSIADL